MKVAESYEECLKLCKELGLVEIIKHGKHDYSRMTEKGCNVWAVLTAIFNSASDPANILKVS